MKVNLILVLAYPSFLSCHFSYGFYIFYAIKINIIYTTFIANLLLYNKYAYSKDIYEF